MSKIDTFKKLLNSPHKRHILVALYDNIVQLGLTDLLDDETYLRLTYRVRFGHALNLNNPKTFNEKLQWLKLNYHNKKHTQLVDKIAVKEYVSEIIGNEYIIPTLGVYKSFDNIDFNILPDRFVLKCNHDSGSVVVCKNKDAFDIQNAKTKLDRKLKKDAFKWGREWPYKDVDRKILAEAYIENESGDELKDYKFMCFSGKVKCSFVCTDRFTEDGLKVTFFDREWNQLPFERYYPKSSVPIPKPIMYEKMVQLAEILSKDEPFVRVDFYEVNSKIYFGEFTFFPGCGWEEFHPEEYDRLLGDWIDLKCISEGRVKA